MSRSDQEPRTSSRRKLRAGPFWAGVVATAVVSGLIGLLGVLVAKNLLDLNVLTPTWVPGDSDKTRFAVLGAGAAIVAGALLELLFIATPTPVQFFLWIVGLLTAAAAVWPFSGKGTTGAQVATAVIMILIGVSLMALLPGVATRTSVRPAGGHDQPGGGDSARAR
jgi:hypothetical protein